MSEVTKCEFCNCTGRFMLKGVNENNVPCHACIGCLFEKIMDQSFDRFLSSNKDYESQFFGYREKFKA